MIDGNIAALNNYLDKCDKYEKSLPSCSICGDRMNEYWELDEEKMCEDCMKEYVYSKKVEVE